MKITPKDKKNLHIFALAPLKSGALGGCLACLGLEQALAQTMGRLAQISTGSSLSGALDKDPIMRNLPLPLP